MTSRLRLVAATVLIPVLLAGCSEDKDDPPAADAGTSSSSAAASATPSTDDDAAAAAQINLTAADLGAGWTTTPAAPRDSGDDDAERALYSCIGLVPTDPVGDDVSSPDFADASGAQISSSVDFYADGAAASAELTAFASPKGLSCLRQSLEKVLSGEVAADGGTVSEVTLARQTSLEVVPDSVGFHLTAKVTVGTQVVVVSADVIGLVRGNAAVQITAFALGGEFPQNVLGNATKAVATRAQTHAA